MWISILCPFHEERRPSAAYTPEGGFNCFGCGLKGNLLKLIRRELKLDGESAARKYEEITGIRISIVPQESEWFPSGGISKATRHLEEGTGLFPPWFRKP